MEHSVNSKTLNCQVSDSTSSLSLPSEPPDVRIWFSSYEFKFPALDSSEILGYSASDRRKFKKDEAGNCDRTRERDLGVVAERLCSNEFVRSKSSPVKDEHKNQSQIESPDSSCSPSLLSEPPDIRNWFSSYVYESFPFNTCNIREEYFSNGRECEEEESSQELTNVGENLEKKVIDEGFRSKGSVKSDRSIGENFWENQPLIEEGNDKANGLNTLHYEKSLQPCPEERTFQSSQSNPAENQKITFNFVNHVNKSFREAPLDSSGNGGSLSNDDRCSKLENSEEFKDSVGVEEKMQKVNHVYLDSGNMCQKTKATQTRNGKQNEGIELSGNGFVTTRKTRGARGNDENSCKRPQEMSLQCCMNIEITSSASWNDANSTKRTPFVEVTNFQHAEVTGKWQRLQKSKPNLGPPLKQLRLEKWVRRNV